MKNLQAFPTNRIRPSPEPLALRFSEAVRVLTQAARAQGLVVPAFRSPPRLVDVDRTIKRRHDGTATVSVRLSGRPWQAVLADLVEGVVVANALGGSTAMRARASLWAAVAHEVPTAAA